MSHSGRGSAWRPRIILWTFDLLYRNTALYWLASTIPFAGRWRVWQRLALPRLRGVAVLELGCGPGWLLADMVAAGYQCQAIDASPAMVRGAQHTLRRRGLAAVITLGRAQALPYPDAAFDCVVSTFPAPYIADPATLCEVARVLRPGGRLIIVEGAHLLSHGLGLRMLVAIQRIVYGRAVVDTTPQPANSDVIEQRLPLRRAGLRGWAEIESGEHWRAYLIIAEKTVATVDADQSLVR